MTPEQREVIAGRLEEEAGTAAYWRDPLHNAYLEDVPALLDEIARLQERLERANKDRDEAVRDCQKAEGRFDQALDLLIDVNGYTPVAAGVPQELEDRIRSFLDSA